MQSYITSGRCCILQLSVILFLLQLFGHKKKFSWDLILCPCVQCWCVCQTSPMSSYLVREGGKNSVLAGRNVIDFQKTEPSFVCFARKHLYFRSRWLHKDIGDHSDLCCCCFIIFCSSYLCDCVCWWYVYFSLTDQQIAGNVLVIELKTKCSSLLNDYDAMVYRWHAAC